MIHTGISFSTPRTHRNSTRKALAACFLASCLGSTGALAEGIPTKSSAALEPEELLVRSLLEINRNQLDTALAEIDNLLKSNPNFRLAHLIKGDLLLARTRPINTLGNVSNVSSQRVEELREEARMRLKRHMELIPANRVPKYLLQMRPDQKYAVVVDTSKSRLYLYENVKGEVRYVADYYISSGKNGAQKLKEGDQKTPIGVYFVTSSLPKNKLSDFYGSGAFPISYPNEWDKRQGRNGSGIWLHGTPSDTYSRPPRASNGCVVLTNQDLNALATTLQIGVTPVIITDQMKWAGTEEVHAQRSALLQQLESWRRDWESRNTEAYLKYYSRNFSANGQSLADWSRQKHQVNAGKSWIKVKLSNVGMFLYPGKEQITVVNFDQDYASSNLSNKMKKRQYWIKENNRWRIIYEGAG